MANQEIENYIKQARESGRTDEDIRQELLNSGWQDKDISRYLADNSGSELLPVWQLFKTALAKFRERYKLAFQIILIPVILGFFSVLGFASDIPLVVIVSAFLLVVAGVFYVISLVPLIYIFGKEEVFGFSEYIKLGLKKFWSYVWIAVLSGFIVFGGYMLLIVPGVIFSVWLAMSYYVLVLEDRKGMEALMRSKYLVSGIFWKTVGRFLFMALVSIIALIPFWIIRFLTDFDLSPLANIILVPLSTAYYAVFFQNLIQVKTEPFVYDKKSARKLIIAGFVGILLGLALLAFGGYYYFTKVKPLLRAPTPALTSTATPDPTANWQTYRNEEYGFEIKYPMDWEVGTSIANQETEGIFLIDKDPTPGGPLIAILPNGEFDTGLPWEDPIESDITFAGVAAKQREWPISMLKFINLTSPRQNWSVPGNRIDVQFGDKKELTNQILSTFKFIK